MRSWRYNIRAPLRETLGKRSSKTIVVGVVIIIIIIVIVVKIRDVSESPSTPPPQTTMRHEIDEYIRPFNENTKTILRWNDFFSTKAPIGLSIFAECKVKNCQLWDRLDSEPDLPYHKYDALVFHGIDTGTSSMDDLPLRRSPEQRYIFTIQESPIMRPNFYNVKNFFNWTATYRRDSDIYAPYVELKRKGALRNINDYVEIWQEPTFKNMKAIPEAFANKSKQVVWFVSNRVAQSKRDVYVNELAKYIQVDIYGQGRRLNCTRADTTCDLMLDTTYKFYLSFENSLCYDYVTEKFPRALHHYIVPIVYGGADYKIYAPPLSYINVQDFASPRALAEYLHYLDRNPKEYQKYFWWKEFYEDGWDMTWCNICEKLHDPDAPNKVYPDMGLWWNYPGVCWTPEEHFSKSMQLPITP